VTFAPRLLPAALIGASVLGLTACGADAHATAAPSHGSASAPASTSPAEPAAEAVAIADPGAGSREEQYGDPTHATDVTVIAQVFAESTLGNAELINAASPQAAIDMTSAFFTGSFMADWLAQAPTDAVGSFRSIPWKAPGLDDGQPVTAAEAHVTDLALLQTGDPANPGAEVTTAYTWTFGPDGTATGTRTYQLYFRAGTDRDSGGFQWQIDGMHSTVSPIDTSGMAGGQ
jgi:hypothetical protein